MSLIRRLFSQAAIRISVIYAVFSLAWILLSDHLVLRLLPDSDQITELQMVKGGVFVFITALLLYELISRSRLESSAPAPAAGTFNAMFPLLVFVLLGMMIGGSGWYAFNAMRDSVRHEIQQNLTNIGELKARQIESWLQERTINLELFANGSQAATALDAWMGGNHTPGQLHYVEERLAQYSKVYGFSVVAVFDLQGKLRYAKGDINPEGHEGAVRQAIAQRRSVLQDFHRHQGDQRVYVGQVTPLIVEGQVRGALYAAVDAGDYFYPLLKSWPGKSQTGETLLLRRDGDRLLFLSPLRHRNALPLSFSQPLSEMARPTSQAAAGERGLLEHVSDYRGRPVLAYVSVIKGSPWLMMAKVDESEVYASLNRLGLFSALTTILLIAFSGWGIRLWWARQQASFAVLQEHEQMQRQALEMRYDALSRYAYDVILIADDHGRLIQANDRALEVYGYTMDELLEKSVHDLRTPAAISLSGDRDQVSGDRDSLLYESEHRRKDGSKFPVEISVRLIESGGQSFCHMVLRDITSRKQAEQRILRLNRMYAALSQTNETIVKLDERDDGKMQEQQLFDAICRIAVESGDMALAWIGRIDPVTGRVLPVASYGRHLEYLDGIEVSLGPDVPEGRGPTGTAMRENKPVIVNDFAHDPRTEQWHQRAAKAGLGASVSFPLPRNGQPYAAFMAYHEQVGAFEEEIIKLLDEMSRDIVFALETLDVRLQRLDADKATKESERRLSTLMGNLPGMAYRCLNDHDWTMLFVSQGCQELTGYPPEDLVMNARRSFNDLIVEEDRQRIWEEVQSGLERNERYQLNYRIVTAQGEVRHVWEQACGIRDQEGRVEAIEGLILDVTRERLADARIRESEERFRSIFESVSDAVFLHDARNGKILDVNPRACEMYGYTREEMLHLDVDALSAGEPPYAARDAMVYLRQARLNHREKFEWHARHRSGQLFWVEVTVKMSMIGETIRLLVTVTDIDERKRNEITLQLDAEVFRHSQEGVVITDPDTCIMTVNPMFTRITGYTAEDAIGTKVRMLRSERHDTEFYAAMWAMINTEGHWQGEIWNRRKDGTVYPEWLSISRVQDATGAVIRYIGVFSDISQRIEAERHIQHLAHFDPLTGLPNRLMLSDRAGQAISMSERKRESLAVLFLDLDHFKNINDTLGHRIGDQLLAELGTRLKAQVRDEDTVSRLGGDEFVFVLPTTDAQGAVHVAQKVMEAAAQPCRIEGHELLISASIGIAMYPDDGRDFDNLLKCADTAMYRAKSIGRNAYCYFTAEMQEQAMRVQQLENALRNALPREELEVCYQPQVSLKTGKVIGMEALVRWHHPEFGDISPSDFIPIAEDNGSILQIGEWVLRQSLRQVSAWRKAGLPLLPVAVNLSTLQFRNHDLVALVTQALQETNVPPEYLELELTESLAMGDPRNVIAIMQELRNLGVKMSIDDFGTGYSSLNYLRRLPVHKIKIDASFVRDLGSNAEAEAIVRAIVSLSRHLNFTTIAEGVETAQQLERLRACGCDEIQGYFFSKPLHADMMEALLRTDRQIALSIPN